MKKTCSVTSSAVCQAPTYREDGNTERCQERDKNNGDLRVHVDDMSLAQRDCFMGRWSVTGVSAGHWNIARSISRTSTSAYRIQV